MSLTVNQRVMGAFAAVALLAAGACNRSGDEGGLGGVADIETVSADVAEATSRVGRVTFLAGEASVRPVGAEDWDVVDLNRPVIEGDELYIPESGQCELGLGANHYARFGENAYVTVSRLDPGWAQLELAEGTMTLALADFDDERFEINSPGAAVIPQRGGSYRIDVLPDGTTRVRVLRGAAEVVTPGGSAIAEEGDTIDLGPNTQGIASAYSGYPNDDWDRWSDERDVYYNDLVVRDVPGPVRTLYGREDIFGIAELVAYGVWQALDDDDDRLVWVPNTALNADWSPYNDGYWGYVPAVGYTWVSNEPWGWAPYHYGRWDYVDAHGWVWAPYRDHTVTSVATWREPYRWNPALVYVWQPEGRDRVAWVPLAPGEPYRPYSATFFGDVPDSVVDFRPRHLVAQRDVVWMSLDELGRPIRPRRLRANEALAWANGDVERVRFAKLPVRDKFLAKGKDLPPGLRPRDEIRRRAMVVDPRSVDDLERAEKRLRKYDKGVSKRERQIVKAERKAMKLERRQADQAIAARQFDTRFEAKRNRKVERRGKGLVPGDVATAPAYNAGGRGKAARAGRRNSAVDAGAPVVVERPGKAERRARKAARRVEGGGGAKAERGAPRAAAGGGAKIERRAQRVAAGGGVKAERRAAKAARQGGDRAGQSGGKKRP